MIAQRIDNANGSGQTAEAERFAVPPEIEDYRDQRWRREGARQIATAYDVERFVEDVGFAAGLTDSRRPGPSVYVAVCGRRDAVLPRNVQKDEEASLAWTLKDEIIARGKLYYAKLARGRATFLAPRMIPHFHAVWGMRRSEEARRTQPAGAGDPPRAAPRMGDGDRRSPAGLGRDRSRRVHASAGRAPGSDARGPECRLLSAEIHLRLDAEHQPLSGSAAHPRPSARSRSVRLPGAFLAGAGLTFQANSRE